MLKLKTLFLLTLFSLNLYSIEVVVSSKKIAYKEKISAKNVTLMEVSKVKKGCIPATVKELKLSEYIAKHYINRGRIICTKDIESYNKNSVLFKFGAIEIEKHGKIIYENDSYIRIKKDNGKVEKIYKDGRLQ